MSSVEYLECRDYAGGNPAANLHDLVGRSSVTRALLGDLPTARTLLQHALEIDPHDEMARKNLITISASGIVVVGEPSTLRRLHKTAESETCHTALV